MRALKIFLSSPSDVAEERRLVRSAVSELESIYRAAQIPIRLELVAWDDPHARVPLEGGKTPQKAVNRYLPLPSECDLTLVVLWTRLGTPPSPELTRADGSQFSSGTVWELEDARRADRPVFIYRRTDLPLLVLNDPQRESRLAQIASVERFFTVVGETNAGAYNPYSGSAEFERLVRQHLSVFVGRRYAADFTAGAPGPLRRRLADFTDYYLGKAASPKPFGGRDTELEFLDTWLSSDDRPSKLLIHGPAARGKTMLLMRWLQHVRLKAPAWRISFVPISIRFGTNRPSAFYSLLAGQLAEIEGVPLSSAVHGSDDMLLDAAMDILDRLGHASIPVLLAFDGLDEATGWEVDTRLLALTSARLRTVVTARSLTTEANEPRGAAWLMRLGWRLGREAEEMSLQPLSPKGIRQLVDAVGLATASSNSSAQLSRELARLSEGDPLLLGYLLGDLQQTGQIAVDQLLSQLGASEAGFSAYFDRWLRDQKPIWTDAAHESSRVLEAVLAILACAMGPLRHGDLEMLLAKAHGIDGGLTQTRLDVLSRFVLRVDGGYVLGHPRLHRYLRDELFRSGAFVERSAQALLDWGRRVCLDVNGGRLEPSRVPRYLLDFHVQQLVDAAAPASDFAALAGAGWCEAWSAEDGSYKRLAGDLKRALAEALRRASASEPTRSWHFQFELLLNSIRNVSRIRPKLLVACAKAGILDLRDARNRLDVVDSEERALGLLGLADIAADDDREELVDEALKSTRQMSREFFANQHRLRTLSEVARRMKGGEDREALEAELLHSLYETKVPSNLYGWLQRLEYAARAASTERTHAVLLQLALSQVTGSNCWDYIEDVLKWTPTELRQAAIEHAEILDRLLREQERGKAAGLPDQETSDGEAPRDERGVGAQDALPYEPGIFLQANALAQFFPYLSASARARTWPRLLTYARSLKPSWEKTHALLNVYDALPVHERESLWPELLAAARRDGPTQEAIACLGGIATHLRGTEIAKGALEEAVAVCLRNLQEESFSRIGPIAHLLHGDLLERCLSATIRAPDPKARLEAIDELAENLDRQQLRSAVDALRRIGDSVYAAVAEAALAIHLPDDEGRAVLESALGVLTDGTTGTLDAKAGELLLRALPPDRWPDIVPRFSDVLKTAGEELFDLATGVPPEHFPEVIDSALHHGDDGTPSIRALIGIASRLSGPSADAAFVVAQRGGYAETALMSLIAGRVSRKLRAGAKQRAFRSLSAFESKFHWTYVEALCGLAPFVNAKRRVELLSRATQMTREHRYIGGVVRLLSVVELDVRDRLIDEALEWVETPPWDHVECAQMLQFAGPERGTEILEVVLSGLRKTEGDDERMSRLGSLPPIPLRHEQAILETIPDLIGRPHRSSVLQVVSRWAPAIARLEGTDGIRAVLRGVRDATRCFP